MKILKKILKTLMWVLIGIIALPLVLLLLIIFLVMCAGSIRYSIDARVGENKKARVEVSYFMRLVHVLVVYTGGKLKTRIRVAWLRFGDSSGKRRRGRKKRTDSGNNRNSGGKNNTDNDDKEKSNPDDEPLIIEESSSDDASTPAGPATSHNTAHSGTSSSTSTTKANSFNSDTTKSDTSSPNQDSQPASSKDTPNPHARDASKDESDPKADKKGISAIFQQIKAVLTYPDRKIIMNLCFQSLQKFIKALKPKHLDIHGVVGFEDPATTGWFMGAYEAITSTLQLRHKIRLLGSYLEKALDLNIQAQGRTRLGSLIWPFVWLYLQRPVRKVIHMNIFRKGD